MALPKVHWAGVGWKLYLSAGISSAAAMMYLVWRSVISLALVTTGLAGAWACRAVEMAIAVRVRVQRGFSWGALGVIFEVGPDCESLPWLQP